MGNGLVTAAYHPIATSAVLAGLGGLYLGYCRKTSRNWTPQIEQAKSYTQFLDSPHDAAKPANKHMYFHLDKFSSATIMDNPDYYYGLLLSKKSPYATEYEFIKHTLSALAQEKTELLMVRKGLHECLLNCNLLPRLGKLPTLNVVTQLIENHRQRGINSNREFINLSKHELTVLDEQIEKLASFSLISPSNWHRLIALPYECDAIEQFWKIYQMIAHVSALEECVKAHQRHING